MYGFFVVSKERGSSTSWQKLLVILVSTASNGAAVKQLTWRSDNDSFYSWERYLAS